MSDKIRANQIITINPGSTIIIDGDKRKYKYVLTEPLVVKTMSVAEANYLGREDDN